MTLTGRLPATKQQLDAIERRADLIEREVVGPFTRAEATEMIHRLDDRIRELRADGTLLAEQDLIRRERWSS